jgi:hypothetical protein
MNENKGEIRVRPEPSLRTIVRFRAAEAIDVVARPTMAILTLAAATYCALQGIDSGDTLQKLAGWGGMGYVMGREIGGTINFVTRRKSS